MIGPSGGRTNPYANVQYGYRRGRPEKGGAETPSEPAVEIGAPTFRIPTGAVFPHPLSERRRAEGNNMSLSISYELLSFRAGNWVIESVYDKKDVAVQEARRLIDGGPLWAGNIHRPLRPWPFIPRSADHDP